MVCDTPSSQDAFTHQIWNSYLKEYRRYAPDSMHFLETRSEVKFKVIVAQLEYATLRHPKMHSQTNEALAIRRIFSPVDMITKAKFSNSPNYFKIRLFG